MKKSTGNTCSTSTRLGSRAATLGRLQAMLCTNPEEVESCDVCNGWIVCQAELARVCVPVYAAAREMGIELLEEERGI